MFWKFGYCKFKEGCHIKHFPEVCKTFQDAKTSKNVQENILKLAKDLYQEITEVFLCSGNETFSLKGKNRAYKD